MSQITLHAPAPVAAPRGAAWGAAAFAAFLKLVEGVWHVGRARQVSMRRSHEAAALRRLAAALSASDPGFASDLYAAADRHMAQIEGR